MSLYTLRLILSVLSLNSLLQIYQNQPIEFSQLSIQHPKFVQFFPSTQMINLLIGLSQIIFLDDENKFTMIFSFVFGLLIIVQNLFFYLPKSINVIFIYCQMIILFYYIYKFSNECYERIQKAQQKQMDIVSDCNQQKRKQQQTKKNVIQKKKTSLQVPTNIEKEQNNEKNEKLDQIQDIPTIQMKEELIQQPIIERAPTDTELETDNQNEFYPPDLSEISTVKDEQRIQIQLIYQGQQHLLNCTFDTFDQITSQFTNNYTNEEIIQVKTHIILNLYDCNDSNFCRLQCLKKLLTLQV